MLLELDEFELFFLLLSRAWPHGRFTVHVTCTMKSQGDIRRDQHKMLERDAESQPSERRSSWNCD